MQDHYDLYLKCDVLLLPDEFDKFRNSDLKNYALFLSHYFNVEALS